MSSPLTHAINAPTKEIRVNLFGQPCLLQGPVDEKTLKLIHSLSPEQLYPHHGTVLTADPTRRALDKLRTSAVPGALEHYRERLIRRLEAQLLLLESIDSYRKTRKPAPILAAGKKYLSGRKLSEFQTQLKKVEKAKDPNSAKCREALDAVFESFSDGIEPDPEEEFHRAIHRMSVQYTCSFEESAEGEEGEGEGE